MIKNEAQGAKNKNLKQQRAKRSLTPFFFISKQNIIKKFKAQSSTHEVYKRSF
jgi:hypothetical protein